MFENTSWPVLFQLQYNCTDIKKKMKSLDIFSSQILPWEKNNVKKMHSNFVFFLLLMSHEWRCIKSTNTPENLKNSVNILLFSYKYFHFNSSKFSILSENILCSFLFQLHHKFVDIWKKIENDWYNFFVLCQKKEDTLRKGKFQ